MDAQRKRLLKQQYKERKPDMGIVCYFCKSSGARYIGGVVDIKATLNSNRVKLDTNFFPNKRLQSSWNQYGAADFEIDVLETLGYDNEADDPKDYAEELEMRAAILIEQTQNAERLR